MIKGIEFDFGSKKLILPALSLGFLEAMQSRLASSKGGLDADHVKLVIDCTFAALKRNYPDMTRDEVADLIDVGNMDDVFAAVMDIGGLLRKGREAAAAGEPSAPKVGADSTPA